MFPYSLRPHHALCALFFQGKGYSKEFVENMDKLLSRNEAQITVTFGADFLCNSCPNLENGACKTYEKVKAYDEKTAELCGFSKGETMSLDEFKNCALEKIVKKGLLKNVCGDCSWSDICKASAEKYL